MAPLVVGCGPTPVEQTQVGVPIASPLDRAKSILQNYASGQPMSSEVDDFPNLITEIRKDDPQKAAILEKGLEDLKKAKGAALKAKSKEILSQL